jgi:NAD-dependent DNA ligase
MTVKRAGDVIPQMVTQQSTSSKDLACLKVLTLHCMHALKYCLCLLVHSCSVYPNPMALCCRWLVACLRRATQLQPLKSLSRSPPIALYACNETLLRLLFPYKSVPVICSVHLFPTALQVVGCLLEARDPSAATQKPFPEPTHCPSCTQKLKFVEAKTKHAKGHLWCSNPGCPAQQLARVKHFVDVCVKGIGGATVEALWERGWLPNPAGLYKLTQVGSGFMILGF